jgi:hypothetical protein
MNYYILPKINCIIDVNPNSSTNDCKPYISTSLLNYYNQTKSQIIDFLSTETDPKLFNQTFDDAIKLVNQYDFIFSIVSGYMCSVSKLTAKTNTFYDLLEILHILNVYDVSNNHKSIQMLHISPNFIDSIECFKLIFKEEYHHHHIGYYNMTYSYNDSNKYNFIFVETDNLNYLTSLIESILVVLKNQKYNGSAIIKVSELFYKPAIDALYLLSSMYDTVYICKPSTNNIASFDRYIVCKNFKLNESSSLYLKINYLKLLVFIKKLENKNIIEILDFNVPCYFKNKIDDSNIIIGQQQIEALDQIVALYKNKNFEEKYEFIKKKNIEKSVAWCEKYKIPFNKFNETFNIFLPIK